jgi:Domain of unknown function (DUF4288)
MPRKRLTIGSSDRRGRVFGEPRREVDDLDKSASFVAGATPRRSTSSLGVMPRATTKSKVPWRNRSPYGWWVASYVQRFEFKDRRPTSQNSRCLVWENTILLRAKTRETAYKKAVAFAQKSSPARWTPHGDPPGRLGRWVNEGLTSLLPIYERIEDGSEILWSEHRNVTLAGVRRRVKSKHSLEIFDDSDADNDA